MTGRHRLGGESIGLSCNLTVVYVSNTCHLCKSEYILTVEVFKNKDEKQTGRQGCYFGVCRIRL